MSELFDEEAGNAPPPARSGSRRSRALIITAVVLVLAFLGLSTFASLYTDRLWYKSGGYSEVFTTLFWTKAGLFVVFGLLMALIVGVNIYLAYRFRPFFRPNSPEQTGLDRYRDAVTPIRTWLLVGVSVVLGAFAGSSAIGEWRDYLLWRNGVPFGQKDAYFHKDIGFYVFTLPWLHYVVDFAMASLVIAVIAAAVVHYLYGGIRLQTPRDRLSGPAQVQLSVLLGLFVLAKAGDYWLDRFDLVNQSGSLITGMTYTADHAVLPAKNILAGIAIICAVLFFVNVWRRTWLLPSVGLGLLAVSAILLGLIWPGIVQQFQVKPSEADKQSTYINQNIKATRAAYDLNAIDVVPYNNDATASKDKLASLIDQTKSVPLVDPQLVNQTFDQNQQVRSYYSVADVLDVDRYDVNNTDRALVLGVRELNQDNISSSDKNWSNLHTVYTHGNGIIAAYANQRPADDGQEQAGTQGTEWAEGLQTNNQHSLTDDSTGPYQTQVYFGEDSPDYSIVGKASASSPDVELDLASSDASSGDTSASADDTTDHTTTYDGGGGVSVGSTFNKLMYAVKFGDPNFLLSQRVNSNSEVLYNRDPRTRVEKFAPWLTIDSDAYPAIIGGHIEWILDGYTTTDRYPGSERESFATMTDDALQAPTTGPQTLPTDEVNYMRNAVKATVDAYTGQVTLYAWDDTDPILKAWESAFPGTVKPKSDIPDDLMSHLRYPEDMFKVQRYQFARYHVTDPGDFYQGNNRWEVPVDPNSTAHLQPPYRLFVNKEDDAASGSSSTDPAQDPAEIWSLTSNYVYYGKNNLAAFVSVDSDATDPADYGKIKVLQVQDTQTNGPSLIANEFAGDPDVRDALQKFNIGGNPPQFGNLLTLPVNDGLIYIEPVYAKNNTTGSGYPILQYVLVSYGGKVGLGTTLTEALADALGVTGSPTTGGGGNGGGNGNGGKEQGSVSDQIRKKLAAAERAFVSAEAAQRDNNTVLWAQLMDKGKKLVGQAVALSVQLPSSSDTGSGTSSGSTPSSGSSPTDTPTESPSASP